MHTPHEQPSIDPIGAARSARPSAPAGRPISYEAPVAAALGVRTDPATAAFDEVVATAVRAGRVDAATGRELRYWQRESVREVRTQAATVLPALLHALDSADRAAADGVREATRSWSAATATTPGRPAEAAASPAADDLAVRRRHNVVAGLTAGTAAASAAAGGRAR